ncbi:MAG: signal peptidase [Thermodesulfobacteriota bacterium]|nr:signal peptidase [Thermodesulfobacteriota bacterium]
MKRLHPDYKRPAIIKNGISIPGTAMIEIMQEVLSRGMSFRFRAGGFSMAPFIRDGDIISVSPLSSIPPGIGDVVAFLHPETKLLCIHRVLYRNNGALMIQGDNLPGNPDGMIPGEAIIGHVTRVERSGRSIKLGLGPERIFLAILSRTGLLEVMRRCAVPFYGYFRRRRALCEKS